MEDRSAARSVHLDLDGAWPAQDANLPARLDARKWGPQLRFCTSSSLIESFAEDIRNELREFILYGAGDFHHLTALWLRRYSEPLTLVSFDNHPDWDLRPPRWACGGWINRALDLDHVRKAVVWGCGNFELNLPNRIFGNRAAVNSGRLEIFAWQERYGTGQSGVWNPISRSNWKERFDAFAEDVRGANVYVTVDLDCLSAGEALTHWENGLFTAGDVAWAVGRLRAAGNLVGGDLCGAWSEPSFARWTQKFASGFDHPKNRGVTLEKARETNRRAYEAIWPVLTGAVEPV